MSDDFDEDEGFAEPDGSERRALEDLLSSQWFAEEMENANYHSAYQFLEELHRELI